MHAAAEAKVVGVEVGRLRQSALKPFSDWKLASVVLVPTLL